MKIIQIASGQYSFQEYDNIKKKNIQSIGHVLYGLDEEGYVYKMHPRDKSWVKIDDLKNKYK